MQYSIHTYSTVNSLGSRLSATTCLPVCCALCQTNLFHQMFAWWSLELGVLAGASSFTKLYFSLAFQGKHPGLQNKSRLMRQQTVPLLIISAAVFRYWVSHWHWTHHGLVYCSVDHMCTLKQTKLRSPMGVVRLKIFSHCTLSKCAKFPLKNIVQGDTDSPVGRLMGNYLCGHIMSSIVEYNVFTI